MKARRFFPVLCLGVLLSGLAGLLNAQEAAAGYRLSAGDAVDIRVHRHEDLSGKFTLGADGAVMLQFIGTVKLTGMTPGQAQERIEALLADGWLRKPEVTVSITDFARNTIIVDGEVKRAAAYSVARNKPFTVSQAIGMAGGFTTRANPKSVMLKRGNKSFTINVKAIYENPSLDIPLRDGDLLVVKESRL